jgi:hypothetical protein
MKRRIIVSIYDDGITIGDALNLLSNLGYDNSLGWEKDCIWKMSDGHLVRADIASNKGSLKFDIWKDKDDD